jgi:hypothetical protein
MPAVMALLGGGAMVDQNMQQKATIKDAENAKASAQADATKAQGNATSGLDAYLKANPGPAQASNAPAAYSGANIPLAGTPPGTGANPASALNTMAGASGIPPAPGGGPGPGMMSTGKQLPPAVLDALRKAMSGSA